MRLMIAFTLVVAAGNGAVWAQADKTGAGEDTVRSWRGLLVDAACRPSPPAKKSAIESPDMKSNMPRATGSGGPSSQKQWSSCPPTPATRTFGLALPDGKMLRFDAKGNSMAEVAMHRRPNEEAAKAPREVTVKGRLAGGKLHAELLH